MKKWILKRWTIVLILACVVCGVVYFTRQSIPNSSEPTVVSNEVTAEKGDIKISLESDGQASINYKNIDFEVSGNLTQIYAKAGQYVLKGQKLAEIDHATYSKAYQTAKLNYDKALLNYKVKQKSGTTDVQTAKARLEEYKIKAEQLEKDYNTMVQLKDVYAVSEIELKKSEWESAVRTYKNEQLSYQSTSDNTLALAVEDLNVKAAKIQLDTAIENLDKTILYAKSDGLILKSDYTIGDTVTPMTDSGNLTASTNHFMVMTTAKQFQVLTSVSEQDLTMVTVGQHVEVVFDALAGEQFTGHVSAIESLPNTDSSGVVSYNVTVDLDNGFELIKIGMTAQLELILKQEKDVIVIPNKAVSLVDGQQQVNIKKAEGTLETRAIKAGLTDGRNVAVHEGLTVGEVVVYETTGK